MRSDTKRKKDLQQRLLVAVLILAGLALALPSAQARNSAASGEAIAQATFQTPEDAGIALAKAAKAGNQAELSQILGPDATTLLITGDSDTDGAAMDSFASKYQQMNRWVEMNDGSRVLYIGADNFAFPVPLAKDATGQWRFDAVAGAQEVRAREIGRNELLAIDACSALAKAEQTYFKNGAAHVYAQRVVSAPGKHDGLYWPAVEGQTAGPLAGLSEFSQSSFAVSDADGSLVIDGYTLKILSAQGADAPDGAKSYLVSGKMTGGFAILAAPLKYGETGIKTFIVSTEGIVYEQDMGADTVKLAASIQEYNPDEYWWPVE